MAFKLAQTFYIDKSSVRDAEHVTLTSIDVYFKKKPLETANRSGIKQPGVTVYLMQTRDDDVPNSAAVLETGTARLEYNSILASADASIPSTFNFMKPLIVKTNQSYALGVSYDGDEDYELWKCREGELIVGTNSPTSGATARNVGHYYEYASVIDSSYNPGTTLSDQWKAINNVDLKFVVRAAVYSAAITDNQITTTYLLPADPTEFIVYDRYHYATKNRTVPGVGEMIFQETPVAYGAVQVNSSNLSVFATGSINFSQLITPTAVFGQSPTDDKPEINQKSYIVLRNGVGPSVQVNVREVVRLVSNTEIMLDRLPSFSNNSATFSVTAVGKLNNASLHWYDGRWWNGSTMDQFVGRKVDMLTLVDTNANSTVRFCNNMVQSVTIAQGGTGYSNNDVINIYPVVNANTANPAHINYLPSYANATANVVTNGSGSITGISFRNAGFGLTSNVVLSLTTTAGTGANLQVEVGSVLRSESSNAAFGNTVVTNVNIHRNYPHCHIKSDQSNTYRMFQHYPYYVMPGQEHLIQVNSPAMKREVDVFTNNDAFDLQVNDGRIYVLASRSNEVMTPGNVTITVANNAVVNTAVQTSSLLEVSITSNNAFSLPMVTTDDVYNYKYIINNDVTGEIKGQGKALARHISTKVTFAESRNAEDIVVYVDAHRPAGTDVKAYARLHNRTDPDAFEDKDWTLLNLTSNNAGVYSSLTNVNDIKEYTFSLGSQLTSVNTISGDVTTTISSANIVGLSTTFTNDLKVNDVVKVYSALFPQNYLVSVVTAVANNTQITIADPIVGASYAGTGFKIDLIGRKANGANTEIGFPYQAFTNKGNSNIVRYYNSAMSKFDTYNTFQIKLVMTSNNASIVPKVDNIRAVGVSA
jgi:hypothetical protein